MAKIFISYSSKNEKLVSCFLEFLQMGMGVNNSDILLEICVVLRQLDIVNLLTFWPYPVKMLNCTEGKRPSETQNARSSTAGKLRRTI